MLDILALALDYQQWKVMMVEATGLARDALHVHIGLAVFVLTRLIWRLRFGWMVAWLAALAFAGGGEWFDMRATAAEGALQPNATHWHDLWNTMLWPTLLAIFGRWLEPKRPPIVAGETPDGPDPSDRKDAEQPLEQA